MTTAMQKKEKLLKKGRKRCTKKQLFIERLIPTAIAVGIIAASIVFHLISYLTNIVISSHGVISDTIAQGYSIGLGRAYAQMLVNLGCFGDDIMTSATAVYDGEGNIVISPKDCYILTVREKDIQSIHFYEAADANSDVFRILAEKYDNGSDELYTFTAEKFAVSGEIFIPIEIAVKDYNGKVIETIASSETIPEGAELHSDDEFYRTKITFYANTASSETYSYMTDHIKGEPQKVRYIDDKNAMMSVSPVIIGENTLYVAELSMVNNDLARSYIILPAVIIALVACIVITILWTSVSYQKLSSLYALDDYRRELTNALAHDLKTPLMTISGYAETMAANPEKSERYISAIMENTAYMDEMIRKTLELSETESGAKKASAEEFSARDAVNDIFSKYRPALDERQITLTSDGDIRLTADKDRFCQLMENLCSNAVKFTDNGGKIAVSLGNGIIELSNDCAAAGELDISEIVKPYVKGDKSRSGRQGCGLGLAIVKNIAELMGFGFEIQNPDGKFIVRLSVMSSAK